MKRINNKKGFTLIEMLVVLGIIGVMSIIIGFSATTLTGNASKNRDKETIREILNAASSYAELSTTGCSSGCNPTLQNLVNEGLLDINIYQKNNPTYASIIKFKNSDKINIARNNGKKTVSFGCSNIVNLENIDNIDTWWGKC